MSIVRTGWRSEPRLRGLAAFALIAFAGLAFVACGDSTRLPEPTPLMTVTPEPEDFPLPNDEDAPPTELRVAYINLHAPAEGDATAVATFDERLDLIVAELLEFEPDIVGFSEAYWSEETGRAASRLAGELLMEFQFVLTNPWPGDAGIDPDDFAIEQGFAEGHLLLSRFPILGAAESGDLGPRDVFDGARRSALHVVVEAPAPIGRIDVYVAQLAGGSETNELGRSRTLAEYIAQTRGEGTMLLMADIGSNDPLVLEPLTSEGYVDLAGKRDGFWAKATCCRDTLLDPQQEAESRTDFVMTDGWEAQTVDVFAEEPHEREDGSLLYASDHNGILAVLPVAEDYLPELTNTAP